MPLPPWQGEQPNFSGSWSCSSSGSGWLTKTFFPAHIFGGDDHRFANAGVAGLATIDNAGIGIIDLPDIHRGILRLFEQALQLLGGQAVEVVGKVGVTLLAQLGNRTQQRRLLFQHFRFVELDAG